MSKDKEKYQMKPKELNINLHVYHENKNSKKHSNKEFDSQGSNCKNGQKHKNKTIIDYLSSDNENIKYLYIKLIIYFVAVVAIFDIILTVLIVVFKITNFIEGITISNCVAVITLAITVWAGLSITNALKKDDFEKFKDDAGRKIDIMEKETNNLKTAFKDMFFKELIQTVDIMSVHIYKILTQNTDNINGRFGELLAIEQLFTQVYNGHYKRIISEDDIIARAKYAIKLIDKYNIEETKDHRIKGYLIFRKAEFYFYKGYAFIHKKSYENAQLYFNEAISHYITTYKEYVPALIVDASEKSSTEFKGEEEDLKIYAYYANTIGNAYYQKYISCKDNGLEIDIKKAKYYCECAVKWSNMKEGLKRELYHRNYGLVLEKRGNTYWEEARLEYYKAVNSPDSNENSFKTLLSIYEKLIKDYLYLEQNVNVEKGREHEILSSIYKNDIRINIYNACLKTLMTHLEEMKLYADISKALYPKSINGYIYSALYYIYSSIVSWINNDFCIVGIKDDIKKNVDSAEADYKILSVIAPYNKDLNKNPLTELINKDILAIKKNI